MNTKLCLSFFLLLLLIPSSTTSFAENISLSTYYPAPFGAYDRLRLVPRSTLLNSADCNASARGSLAVDSTNKMQFCGVSGWEGVGGWTQSGDNFYPSNVSNPSLRVGIGTATPTQPLEVNGTILGTSLMSTSILSKNFSGRSIDLNTNAYNGTIDFKIEDGAVFRAISAGIYNPANADMFFQLKPGTTAGYGYVETWDGAGLIVGTGGNTPVARPILFRPNRTTQMTLTSDGNLGIGTVVPINKLDVAGGVAVGSNYYGVSTAPSNGLIVGGNVGVGTSAPGNSRLAVLVDSSIAGGSAASANPIVRITGTTSSHSNLGRDVWFRAEGKSVVGDGIDDQGVVWIEYGTEDDEVQAPILTLADWDNAPRIQFIQVVNGTELAPDHLSWIGMSRGELANVDPNDNPSGDMSIMAGYNTGTKTASANVGIGTLNPKRSLHINDVMRLEPRNAAPASPAEGDIYMDSVLHKLRVYASGSWHDCW